MRLLLDTNVVLWSRSAPQRLAAARALVEDGTNELLVSAVVAWEVAIKYALGRLELPRAPAEFLPDLMRALDASSVAITHVHALGVAALPPLHGDPFDRLLAAQAVALEATLVTGDAILAEYPCETLLV